MTHRITLIPGDGIGPEVVEATVQAVEATGASIQWERFDSVGAAAVEREGTPLPEALIDQIKDTRVALKGPITTPVGKGFKSVNVQLRQKLDLHANVRPAKTMPGIPTRFEDVDLIIFRENTEGLYSGIETFDERNQIADSTARITRLGSERIIRFAFEYARRHGRKQLTLVHKANILKLSSGMFLEIGRAMASEYPDVEFNDRIIDNMCMQLVMRPERYDCIVTTNLFGDILSDLAAGLVGGLGVIAGANIGEKYAIFEAVHGSAPDIAGQNKANPTALMLSAEMMLRHIGETDAANRLHAGLRETMREGTHLTADVGGHSSTSEYAARVAHHVAALG
ncbi:MAG: isocitrate/isopropylmalate dehydrogenase family protein [Rhodothermales bacterium]